MRRDRLRPEELAFTEGVGYLDLALDELCAAKLILVPDVGEWSPPDSSLRIAVDQDDEANCGARHLREIDARLRDLLPESQHGTLDEWRSEWLSHTARVAQVGWLVGVRTAIRRPGVA